MDSLRPTATAVAKASLSLEDFSSNVARVDTVSFDLLGRRGRSNMTRLHGFAHRPGTELVDGEPNRFIDLVLERTGGL